MDTRVTVVLFGRTQGVGFRAFARRRALGLGVRGYARNLPDGAVEVVAEGARASLDLYVEALRQGPDFARVTDAQVTWSQPTGEFAGFSIRM